MSRTTPYLSTARHSQWRLPLIFSCTSSRCHLSLGDRKSTRLNSSHRCISYAVFCLKKKFQHLEKAIPTDLLPLPKLIQVAAIAKPLPLHKANTLKHASVHILV